ncbi:NAD(+) diphosphatase [Microbacterium schleiferi]|uniref:NAD(+) diphosphatase n=2 Tax=Microbacterium schleiferi TaxID=69362 RepID=A0ABU7V5S1_9MICO
MRSSAVPPLARSGFDRAEHRRTAIGSAPDDMALVLPVHSDRAPVTADAGSGAPLRWWPSTEPALAGADGEYAFLGSGPDGTDRWVLALREIPPGLDDAVSWASLRVIGGELGDADGGALVAAVSLGRWLLDSAHCPRCGSMSQLQSAGWSRRCPSCEHDLFPRTDPAVIVAVTDPAGTRLLLGSHVAWGMGRFSCFAGFVEAGEPLEAAVTREILEEAGVHIEDMTYVASQAWPYPRSLMVGFSAVTSTEIPVADGEEIIEVRWFDRAEIGAALAGDSDVQLPGPSSIARALIEQWYRSAQQ